MSLNTNQQREFLIEHVPPEIMRAFAKTKPGHSVKKLYEDKETLVDELLRLCDGAMIQRICDEFPVSENLSSWFFIPEESFNKKHLTAKLNERIPSNVRNGITPRDVGQEPELYRVEEQPDVVIFRYVAKDENQSLAVSFGEKTTIQVLNYYSAVLHYSEPHILLFGPYASSKAQAVVDDLNDKLGLNTKWLLIRPERGSSRDFYNKIKKKLQANLVETKRQDPAGNYRTVALQSKYKQPDLEKNPDFKDKYLHADSYHDILEYICTNALGLSETVHVKFGHPFGRFTFRSGTSLSSIIYFEQNAQQIVK